MLSVVVIYVHEAVLQAVEEHQKLIKDQVEIEKKTGLSIQGCTLFETIFEVCIHLVTLLKNFTGLCFIKCVKNRQVKFAEQLRKDFKMSDNQ